MKIFDVTVPLSEDMPIYEGDPDVQIASVSAIAAGGTANVSKACFGLHAGTHIDAPNHFLDGTRRAADLDLGKMIGPCRVIELERSVTAVGPEHLPSLAGVERLLLKTRNSEFWNDTSSGFRTDFTFITPEAAAVLAESDIKLVGIDYLSVEQFGSADFATHKLLLEKEIVVLEGLDLRKIEPGDYELICLPLKYLGGSGDGAPARVILRR